MKVYLEALVVLLSFLLVFLWQNSNLALYTVPAIGFLVFMFLLISMKTKKSFNFGGPVSFFVLNSVLLLLIFSTGGITSNLFFILYFLLFGAAFILDPRTVFIFPIGVVILFFSQLSGSEFGTNLLKLGSIILLSPLAYLFGMQFRKNDEESDEVLQTKERAVGAANEISHDVEDVIKSAENKLDPTEVQKLNEVLEETETLREEKKQP